MKVIIVLFMILSNFCLQLDLFGPVSFRPEPNKQMRENNNNAKL